MRIYISIVCALILCQCHVFASERLVSEKTDAPIIIHYGMNDSHSRSWVQENDNGEIGISIFRRPADSFFGELIFRTIHPDGSKSEELVTTGEHLEKTVLLYDSLSKPHIFLARSNDSIQIVDHYFKNVEGQYDSAC